MSRLDKHVNHVRSVYSRPIYKSYLAQLIDMLWAAGQKKGA